MKQNLFFRLATGMLSMLMLAALLVVTSCKEDEEPEPATIAFASADATVSENIGLVNLNLSLSKAAVKDGSIAITASGDASAVTFTSTINITQGQTSAIVPVTVANNSTIDGNQEVVFTLTSPGEGLILGTQTTFTLTITDDEGPTTANFAVATGTVAENVEGGIEVTIALSSPADVAGTIVVQYTPTDAAITTTPAATTASLTVPVAVNDEEVSFTVVPTNDEADADDYEVVFTISSTTGGVLKGTNVTYTLTVEDDDDIVPTNIADIRALYTTADVTITDELYIKGTVISSNSNVTNRNLFIQDESGSIVLRFAAAHTFVQGDELLVNITGLVLTRAAGGSNTGPLQIGGNDGFALDKATKTGTATVPAAVTATITQVNTGDYEGKLVTLEDVFFIEADGILTLNGNRSVSDGLNPMVVRTESYAPWDEQLMPLGSGDIKGIASIFNGTVQIIPLVAEHIFANNPEGTIGITQSLTDFGSVNNGAESAIQTYSLQGTTLISDIDIIASSGFQISLEQTGTYSSSLIIPLANANNPQTIFVKFAPTSGVNGVINGTLTHKSQGAATVIVPVTGTEAGNGASTLLVIDNFDYGTSAGNLTAVSSNAWKNHSGTGSFIQYQTTSLIMSDYPGSGVGGSTAFAGGSGSREDVNYEFADQTSGTIYASALLRLSSLTTTQDYVFHLRQSGGAFGTRVHMIDDGAGKVKLGVSNNGAVQYSSTLYDYNSTYIVVIKYDFATHTSSLFVLSVVTASEPTPDATDASSFTPSDYNQICIRQGSQAQSGEIDGVRVALSWSDLFE